MAYAVDPATGAPVFPLRSTSGVESVVMRLLTRLRGVYGDWPTDTTHGLFRLAWLEESPSGLALELAVRTQLTADPGVTAVQSVTVSGSTSKVVAATIDIEEDGETATVALNLDPYDTRGAPAYTVIGGVLGQGVSTIL